MQFSDLFSMSAKFDGIEWDKVRLAIEAGEDMSELDARGTPYSWQFGECPVETFNIALEKGINIDAMLITQLVKSGNVSVLKSLIEQGYDLNLSPPVIDGFSAMAGHVMELVPFMGLERNYEGSEGVFGEIANLLIDNDVDVNAQDSSGRTALFVAAIRDNMALVEFLLKNGADKAHTNVEGKTAADVADKKASCLKLLK